MVHLKIVFYLVQDGCKSSWDVHIAGLCNRGILAYSTPGHNSDSSAPCSATLPLHSCLVQVRPVALETVPKL